MSAMSDLAATRDLLPPFIPHNGGVWQGDNFRTADECHRLLAGYRADALRTDWWAAIAKVRAAELEQAMRAAGIIQPERKAA